MQQFAKLDGVLVFADRFFNFCKFEKAADYPADRVKWMDWFQELYDLESEAQESGLVGDELLSFRRAGAKPVWAMMRAELDSIGDRYGASGVAQERLTQGVELPSQSLG